MKRRILKWALLGVAALVLVVIAAVWLALDGIIRRTVEAQATASTKLETRLDAATLSLFGGKLNLSGLSIASPAGFDTPQFFTMKDVDVEVAYSQLRNQPIRIERLVLDSPQLLIEQKGGGLNVMAALAGMPPSEKSDMRLMIGELAVKDTAVVVRPGLPMLKPEYKVTIPSVVLRDIGMGSDSAAGNGAAIKDVLTKVLVALVNEVQKRGDIPIPLDVKAAGSAIPQTLLDAAKLPLPKRDTKTSGGK
jgi:hypothetical protein